VGVVTPYQVIVGPADLYLGDYGATEPADTAVNSTPAASAWDPLGSTQDGTTLNVEQSFYTVSVDQINDPVGSVPTSRAVKVQTNLAEATLENLQYALNDGATISSGSGYRSLEPEADGDEMHPTYKALLVHGYAPADADGTSRRRMIVIRKVLNVDNVGVPYKKDGTTVVPVTLLGHYVSSSTKPYKIIDEVSA